MKRAIFVLAALLLLPAAGRAQGMDFTLSTGEIAMDALYDGTTLTVEGSAPEGSQVVVRFVGSPQDLRMKQKGRVLGLLWMNKNSLLFGNVPTVCLVESSSPLGGLGAAGAGLGLAGLADAVTVEPASADRAALLPELVRLKSREGLFREETAEVRLGVDHDGVRDFSARLAIPSRLSPGAYAVEVAAVKNGEVTARASKSVEAKLVGAPAFLAELAFNHGAVYGALASLIAILGGLAIGLVFQSKGAH